MATNAPSGEDHRSKLLGVWKLVSHKQNFLHDGVVKEALGKDPKGFYMFTKDRLMVILTAANRSPPTTDAEATMILKTMTAYSATYEVDAEKFVFTPDVSHNEVYVGQEQTRFYQINGDKMTITSPEQAPAQEPDKRMIGTVEFVRVS